MPSRARFTVMSALLLVVLSPFILAQRQPGGRDRDVARPERAGPVQGGPPPVPSGDAAFDIASLDLVLMRDLFKGGDGRPVSFDAETARTRGYAEASIQIAQEMAALTNELVSAAAGAAKRKGSTDVRDLRVDVQKNYKLLPSFFQHAARRSLEGDAGPLGKDSLWGEALSAIPLLGEVTCGSFLKPRPSRKADWRRRSVSNAEKSLKSWGYHQTMNPDRAFGGGWTRPQTYKRLVCGWDTYRDHALVVNSKTINEQDYAGFTPRGEPNPEFLRSGPWPYLHWPAYVLWWHLWGPGK